MTNTRKNYRLDVDKIKTLKDVRNVFDSICFVGYYDADDPNDENYYLSEYFTILQEPPELTFSTPRKTLDEIQQEFDEKIDKQIEDVEYQFSKKITRIIEDIEYARKNGSFPAKLDYSKLTATGGNITSNFVIKEGGKEVGYYTFGSGYFKYYKRDKPNFVVRFCMDKLLGFKWIDDK
jgi:hypothetical protein